MSRLEKEVHRVDLGVEDKDKITRVGDSEGPRDESQVVNKHKELNYSPILEKNGNKDINI